MVIEYIRELEGRRTIGDEEASNASALSAELERLNINTKKTNKKTNKKNKQKNYNNDSLINEANYINKRLMIND